MSGEDALRETVVALHAAQLCEQLLAQGDTVQAVAIANQVVNETLDRLNEFSETTTVATSLIARALIARALLHTAAHWSADFGGPTLDVHLAALQSLADQPPAEIEGVCWSEDEQPPGRVH